MAFPVWGASSVSVSDLDGDGDLDGLATASQDTKVDWYANSNGLGTYLSFETISAQVTGGQAVSANDLDADGDEDVLVGSSDLAWHENQDGSGTLWSKVSISSASASAACLSDMDGDGDSDVLTAIGPSGLGWHPNSDGMGSFASAQVFATQSATTESLLAMDLDGDGDSDALSASSFDDKIAWYTNTDGLGAFGSQQLLVSSAPGARGIVTADLDGDGDPDALAGAISTNEVAWYENTDGLGAFGIQRVISTTATGGGLVAAADLDGDGDKDALAVESEFGWYENIDGLGTFGAHRAVSILAAVPGNSFYAEDFDGDGDLDLALTMLFPDAIAWCENLDGLGTFGSQRTINVINGPAVIVSEDVDGDGDSDVVSITPNDGRLSWYENQDGTGNFGRERLIGGGAFGAEHLHAADVDSDGDQDLIATWYNQGNLQGRVVWFENLDGQGSAWADRLISESLAAYPRTSFATDLDGDGDRDVLVTLGNLDRVQWHENLDGRGAFGPGQIISSQVDGALFVIAEDLDGDSDQDLLVTATGGGQILRFENSCPGGFASSEAVRLGVPPNPTAFLPGLSSGPVLGRTWDPVIDHTTFLPSALIDVVGVTPSGTNVPLPPFGTLLCDVFSFAPYQHTSQPGVPFAVPIPNNCALAGVSLASQGVSIDGAGTVLLTNALDIILGTP